MAGSHINAFELTSYIRGLHVYKEVWTPYVGEELSIKKENRNLYNTFAVAVEKEGDVVGHLPQSISRNVSYFISHSGNNATCTVTGPRVNRGVGLGVEVSCTYRFTGQKLFVKRLKELLYNKK